MQERANPILVEVTRGTRVESVHRGAVAVVDAEGKAALALGDIDAEIYPRSAFKMLQAVPLVALGAADGFGLSTEALALACASHSGEPAQIERVEAWLTRLGLSPASLVCGPEGGPAPNARLAHNCSGKHAGFLTLALHLGAPTQGYTEPDHPVQKEVRAALSAFTGVPEAALHSGRDGCGAPAFVMPLRALARALARFVSGRGLSPSHAEAARRLAAAMLAHPALVAGEGRPCTDLMLASKGRVIVKAGAEGVFAAGLTAEGLGVAVKIDDGAPRAARIAIGTVLTLLGAVPADDPQTAAYREAPVLDSAGNVVGHVRPAPLLSFDARDLLKRNAPTSPQRSA
jgi:L-asparaginase II